MRHQQYDSDARLVDIRFRARSETAERACSPLESHSKTRHRINPLPSSVRLSSLTKAMPELKSIEIHLPVKYFSIWESYDWTIMGQQCVHSAIHDASYSQELLENYPQPARDYSPLTKLSALWTADMVRCPNTPQVTARQQSIAFNYIDDYFIDEYCKTL